VLDSQGGHISITGEQVTNDFLASTGNASGSIDIAAGGSVHSSEGPGGKGDVAIITGHFSNEGPVYAQNQAWVQVRPSDPPVT
jgi:hypothetical protein